MAPADGGRRIRGTVLAREITVTPVESNDYEYSFPDDANTRRYEAFSEKKPRHSKLAGRRPPQRTSLSGNRPGDSPRAGAGQTTTRKMIRRPLNRWRCYRANRPLILDRAVVERARLCFAGEFGYELISWIPYLNYLAAMRGLRLKTASRPGSSVLYEFSQDHQELTSQEIGGM